MNNIERIKELTTQLNHYRNEYYNNANSEISDFDYDKLFDELKALEEQLGFTMSNSPTQTVGYEVVSELPKVTHGHPMLSLDKCHSVEEIIKFANGHDLVAMLKMDGITVSARYENSRLVKLETRGNGIEGNDITIHARSFENLPINIEETRTVVIDGEAIITYEDFERINAQIPNEDDKYKNPRNLAAGTLNLLDNKISAKRHLKFIAWDVIEGSDSNVFTKRLDFARDLGFSVVLHWKNNNQQMLIKDNLLSTLNFVRNEAKELGYPIDGVVFKFNDVEYGKSLGATGHHFKNGIAYKYAEDRETTVLRDIEWSAGKTGILTPVAIFDSVELAGSTVSRASLHNISIMKNLNINVGAKITVVKKNEIIPQIIECDSDKHKFTIPDICPICGGKTEIVKDNDSEFLMCKNENCKGKLLGKLTHFASKNALNIDGLSESTLKKFIELGWCKNFIDVINLRDYANQMIKLEGFGKQSVNKLMIAVDKATHTTLDRFIYSLSIPLIGRTASKTISKYFNGDYEKFIEDIESMNWTKLDDFGDAMDYEMNHYFLNHKDEIRSLAKYFVFENKTENNISGGKLTGLNFCITGKLNNFENRDALVSNIEGNGGKFVSSVSKGLNFLINNDNTNQSSKNVKAMKLNIPIITEEDYLKMIGE